MIVKAATFGSPLFYTRSAFCTAPPATGRRRWVLLHPGVGPRSPLLRSACSKGGKYS